MASVRSRERADGSTYRQLLWRDPDGRQRSQSYDDTPEELAQLAADKAYVEAYGRVPAISLARRSGGGGTVADLVALRLAQTSGVTPATLGNYRRYATYIVPVLGHIAAEDLTRADVARWIDRLPRELAHSTIAAIYRFLMSVLATGVREGWLARNPASRMRIPRRDAVDQRVRILTGEELERMLDEVGDHYRPFVLFLATTGCRFSEATALTVGDVDLGPYPRVHITKAHKRDGGRYYVGPPKTDASVRTVMLAPPMVPHLLPLVRGRKRSELVFQSTWGKAVDSRNFWRSVWGPAAKRSGIDPPPRIHDLRHTHVSHLIAEGRPLTAIQRRLGHASITVTSDTYGHLMPDAQEQDAAAAAASMMRFGAVPVTRPVASVGEIES